MTYKTIPISQPFGTDDRYYSDKELLRELRPPFLPVYERRLVPGLDEYRRKKKLEGIKERLAELKRLKNK